MSRLTYMIRGLLFGILIAFCYLVSFFLIMDLCIRDFGVCLNPIFATLFIPIIEIFSLFNSIFIGTVFIVSVFAIFGSIIGLSMDLRGTTVQFNFIRKLIQVYIIVGSILIPIVFLMQNSAMQILMSYIGGLLFSIVLVYFFKWHREYKNKL